MSQSIKPKVTALDHVVLTVTDIMTTCRFYEDVLGMTAASFEGSDGTTRWALNYGVQKINLHPAGREFEPKARHPRPGSADLCFISDTPLKTWQGYLEGHGVGIELGPVPRTGARGRLTSIYLRDPDGNLIEIGVAAD